MENGDDRTQSTAQVAPFYSGVLAPNHSGDDTDGWWGLNVSPPRGRCLGRLPRLPHNPM